MKLTMTFSSALRLSSLELGKLTCWLGVIGLFLISAEKLTAHEPHDGHAHSDEGNWYKGNLHTHSLWSDGNDYPEVICKWYKDHGYHFLTLSDHNILSVGNKWINANVAEKRGAVKGLDRYKKLFGEDWVQTREKAGVLQVRLKPLTEFRPLFDEPNKFLLIQGEEITDSFQRHPIHINATHTHDLIKPQGGKSLRETMSNNLKAVKRQADRLNRPILAHLNHPNFGYAVTAEDMAEVLEEKFFEVYNGHPSVNHRGDKDRPGVEKMWDIANTIRLAKLNQPPLMGVATDDSHNYFGTAGSTSGRGWVMVKAKRLTPETLIHAMESGNFYASSGVSLSSIHFEKASKTLTVKVIPVEGEKYSIDFVGTRKPTNATDKKEDDTFDINNLKVGEVLKSELGNTATYKFSGDEYYVRAVIRSNKAPENPIFRDQKKKAWTQSFGWTLQK